MPEDIALDPVQSEIWAWLCPPVNNFSEQDIPTLRLLTYWHAVAEQAQQAIHSEDGRINIFDKIGVKPYKTPDGWEVPLVRKNPALTILKEASSEIRALSDMLGLSPLAALAHAASWTPPRSRPQRTRRACSAQSTRPTSCLRR